MNLIVKHARKRKIEIRREFFNYNTWRSIQRVHSHHYGKSFVARFEFYLICLMLLSSCCSSAAVAVAITSMGNTNKHTTFNANQ